MLEGFEPEPEKPSKKRTPKAVKPAAKAGGEQVSKPMASVSRTVSPSVTPNFSPRAVVDTCLLQPNHRHQALRQSSPEKPWSSSIRTR